MYAGRRKAIGKISGRLSGICSDCRQNRRRVNRRRILLCGCHRNCLPDFRQRNHRPGSCYSGCCCQSCRQSLLNGCCQNADRQMSRRPGVRCCPYLQIRWIFRKSIFYSLAAAQPPALLSYLSLSTPGASALARPRHGPARPQPEKLPVLLYLSWQTCSRTKA